MLKVREMTGLYVKTLSFTFSKLVKVTKEEKHVQSCDNCHKSFIKYVSVKHIVKLIEGYDNFFEANFYCLGCCKKENMFQEEVSSFKFPKTKTKLVAVEWTIKNTPKIMEKRNWLVVECSNCELKFPDYMMHKIYPDECRVCAAYQDLDNAEDYKEKAVAQEELDIAKAYYKSEDMEKGLTSYHMGLE